MQDVDPYHATHLSDLDVIHEASESADDTEACCCCEHGNYAYGFIACCFCALLGLLFGFLVGAFMFGILAAQLSDSQAFVSIFGLAGSVFGALLACFCCGLNNWRWCSSGDAPCVCPKEGLCCSTFLKWFHIILAHWVVQAIYVAITMAIFFVTTGDMCYRCAEEQVQARDRCPWLCNFGELHLRKPVSLRVREQVANYYAEKYNDSQFLTWVESYRETEFERGSNTFFLTEYTGSMWNKTWSSDLYIDPGRSLLTLGSHTTDFVGIRLFGQNMKINGTDLSLDEVVFFTMEGLVLWGKFDATSEKINGYVILEADFNSKFMNQVTTAEVSVVRGSFSLWPESQDGYRETQKTFFKRTRHFFTCGHLQALFGLTFEAVTEKLVDPALCETSWFRQAKAECCAEKSGGNMLGIGDQNERAECPWICPKDWPMVNNILDDEYDDAPAVTCVAYQMYYIQESLELIFPCNGFRWNGKCDSHSWKESWFYPAYLLPPGQQSPKYFAKWPPDDRQCSSDLRQEIAPICCPVHCNTFIMNIMCGCLVLLIWFDMLIRVAFQSKTGNIFRLSSWTEFLLPTFHRLELFLLVPACARLIFGAVWTSQVTIDFCKMMAPFNYTLLFHRLIRIYISLTAVTVKSSKKKRKIFEHKFWFHEHEHRRQKYHGRRVVRCQRCLDRCLFQCFIAGLMIIFGFLSVAFAKPDDATRTMRSIRSTAFLIFLLGSGEFMLRCAAQGGEVFFKIRWHKVEVLIFAILQTSLIYTYGFHNESWEANKVNCVIFILSALCHRAIRAIGIRHGVDASGWGALGIGDAKGYQLFDAMWGDLIEVPSTNVEIKMDVDISVSITKAKLKPAALEGLHLPIVPCEGLVEEFKVKMKNQGPLSKLNFNVIGRKEQKTDMATDVNIKNVLLLFGPGEGLSEAGGFPGALFGSYWNPDNVKEAKSRLVELMCKRIKAQVNSSVVEAEEGPGRTSVADRFRQMKGRHLAGFKEKGLRHLTVDIYNMTLQLEDEESQLDCGHLVIGMKIGKIHIERHIRERLNCELARLSFRVETIGNSTSRPSLVSGESARSFRQHYVELLRKHPGTLCKSLTQSHNREVFRQCVRDLSGWVESSFTRSDNRQHTRIELSPERHLVFSLPRLKLIAGPRSLALSSMKEESKKEKNGMRDCVRHRSEHIKKRVEDGGGFFGRGSYLNAADVSYSSDLMNQEWLYHTSMRPIIISICNEQIKSLRTLASSVKRWVLYDNALRWHPGIIFSRALHNASSEQDDYQLCAVRRIPERWHGEEEEEPIREQLCLATPSERKSLAQMWWIYALHGVLAQMQRRPNLFAADLIWRAQAVRKYSALLLEVAKRGMTGLSMQLQNLQFLPGEKDELLDLQQRLSLQDIARCRKDVLQQITQAEADEIAASDSKKFLGRLWNWKLGSMGSSSNLVEPQFDDVESQQLGTGSLGIDSRSRFFTVESLDTADSESSQANASAPGKLLAHVLRNVTGEWQIKLPEVKIRLLHWDSSERPLFFKMKALSIFLEGTFSQESFAARKSSASPEVPLVQAVEQVEQQVPTLPQLLQVLAPFISVIVSVDFFQVVSAGTAFRYVKVPRHVFLCTERVVLPEASHPGLVSGDHLGKPVAFALRVSPGTLQGKATCEMYWGEVRACISDVLLLAVKRHLGVLAAQASGWYYDDGSEKYASALIMNIEEQYHDGFTRKSVRYGPLHSSSSTQELSVLLRVKLRKAQIFFQKWVRLIGRAFDCDATLCHGGFHLVQVGSYRGSQVLVEEITCPPFGGYLSGGADARMGNANLGASFAYQGHVFEAFDKFYDPELLPPETPKLLASAAQRKGFFDTINDSVKGSSNGKSNGEAGTTKTRTCWNVCCDAPHEPKKIVEVQTDNERSVISETVAARSRSRQSETIAAPSRKESNRSLFLQTGSMSVDNNVFDETSGTYSARICDLHKERGKERGKGESLFSQLNRESAETMKRFKQVDFVKVRSAVFDPAATVGIRSTRTRTGSSLDEDKSWSL